MKAKECSLPQMTEEDIFYEFPITQNTQDEIQLAVTIKDQKRLELEEKAMLKQQKIDDKLMNKFGPDALTNKPSKEEKERLRREKISAKLIAKFGPDALTNKPKKTAPQQKHGKKRPASNVQKNKERDDKLENNVKEGFFIPYQPSNLHSERGYSINTNFGKESREAQFELMQDEHLGFTRQKMIKKKWDTKKDKFTGKRLQEKKIKTESGRYVYLIYCLKDSFINKI